MASRSILSEGLLHIGSKPHSVNLYHETAGYVLAGSCLRLQGAVWGFQWFDGRAFHGRKFKDEESARIAFEALTS